MDSTKNKLIKIMEELNMEDEIACISHQTNIKTKDEVINTVITNEPLNRNEYINKKTQEINLIKNEILKNKKNVNDSYNVQYYKEISSHRKVIGKIIVFFKKTIRKSLKYLIYPIINEQNNFNFSVVNSVNSLSECIVKINDYARSQSILNKELLDSQEMLSKIFDNITKKEEEQNDDLIVLKNRINHLFNMYNEIESKYGNRIGNLSIKEDRETQKTSIKTKTVYEDINYYKFENAFRGSRENVKKSQMTYLEYFINKKDVLDLGSGRGEFLEILKENNIGAVGVDMYKEFVDYCNANGYNAIYGDAIEYLHSLKNNTLGGIFSSQLIEHIENDELVQLCKDAYDKLQDGAYIVIETPNPTCLATFRNGFYMDPSHYKPVHPKTLMFYLQSSGFKNLKIIYTESSKEEYKLPLLNGKEIYNLEEFNDGINMLSDILFGSQDYAVIAQK